MIREETTEQRDSALIGLIIHRAQLLNVDYRSPLHLAMDIERAHAVTPINLHGLLTAPLCDFLHDLYGIMLIDRTTGKFEPGFSLRYARR